MIIACINEYCFKKNTYPEQTRSVSTMENPIYETTYPNSQDPRTIKNRIYETIDHGNYSRIPPHQIVYHENSNRPYDSLQTYTI